MMGLVHRTDRKHAQQIIHDYSRFNRDSLRLIERERERENDSNRKIRPHTPSIDMLADLFDPSTLERNFKKGEGKLLLCNLGRRDTNAVDVTVEQNSLVFALGASTGLHPLADAGTLPESIEETHPARVSVRVVIVTHDLLDGVGGLVGVVKGNRADIVVQNVGFDDSVQDVTADEAKVTVDGASRPTDKVPCFRLVVGKGRVGVLEVGDGHQPVVHPQVRNPIPDEQVGPPVLRPNQIQD